MQNHLRALVFFAAFVSGIALAEVFEDPLDRSYINDDLHLQNLGEYGFTPEKDLTLPDPKGAKEGLDHILGGKGFRLFVPEDLFKVLIVREKEEKFESRRQWIIYGNAPSPKSRKLGGLYSNGRDVGLSYALVEDNKEKYVTFTCFQCHAGMVAGKLIAGVGNAHIDQSSLNENLGTYKKIRDKAADLPKFLVDLVGNLTRDRREHLEYFTLYSETILRPAIKGARTRGDDYGPYPVWQLLAQLKDPKGSGFEVHALDANTPELRARQDLIAKTPLGPVDRRPWWLRKHDIKSYVYGDTLAAPESGKDFAVNFTVPHTGVNSTYAKRTEEISTILKFALQTKAPAYPRALNWDTVEKGEALYAANCARCHGEFVPNEKGKPQKGWVLKYRSLKYAGTHPDWKGKSLPEILYSAGKNPVDPKWTEDTDLVYSRALQLFGGFNPDTGKDTAVSLTGYAAGMREFFSKNFKIADEKLLAVYNPRHSGYRAPPLVGIWASAPYLHNGSVPTLKDLFEVYEGPRPPLWVRVYDTSEEESYDFTNVGIRTEIPEGKIPPMPSEGFDHVRALNYRRFYDTSRPGYSNKGARTCGPNLASKKDKLAVIEFLKALSDESVKPEGDPSKWGRPL